MKPQAWMEADYGTVLSAMEADGRGLWNIPLYLRDDVLEEVAREFDKMKVLGDTAASFAAYVRGMKSCQKENPSA